VPARSASTILAKRALFDAIASSSTSGDTHACLPGLPAITRPLRTHSEAAWEPGVQTVMTKSKSDESNTVEFLS
jgi:hypothetical protein